MPVMMIGDPSSMKRNYVDLKGEIEAYVDSDSNYSYVGHNFNELFFVTSHS